MWIGTAVDPNTQISQKNHEIYLEQKKAHEKAIAEINKTIVYVTPSGRKYHRRSHYTFATRYGLADAEQSYEPCAVCNPPYRRLPQAPQPVRQLPASWVALAVAFGSWLAMCAFGRAIYFVAERLDAVEAAPHPE